MIERNKKIIAFNYFGGKYQHVGWILKHLPHTFSYVEVFGGSGAVLFNKKPTRIETLNDINSTIVNFFSVLRERPEELITKIYLTPYSREEYTFCYKHMDEGDEVERARRFFTVVGQSFNGSYSRQTGWKTATKESRALVAESISRWNSKIPNLMKVVERLKTVQITNFDFSVVFEKFDSERTLFYCDPPYVLCTRGNRNEYEHEMDDPDHEKFLSIAKRLKGQVAISGYESDLYNDNLAGWHKLKAKVKRITMFASPRQEILWTNYDPHFSNPRLFNE